MRASPRAARGNRSVAQGVARHGDRPRATANSTRCGMTSEDVEALVALLGAAGRVLEPIVDGALAEPAPTTLEDGVQQVADVVVHLGTTLGADLLRLLLTLLGYLTAAPVLRDIVDDLRGGLDP